jgi:hypothetical protein
MPTAAVHFCWWAVPTLRSPAAVFFGELQLLKILHRDFEQ